MAGMAVEIGQCYIDGCGEAALLFCCDLEEGVPVDGWRTYKVRTPTRIYCHAHAFLAESRTYHLDGMIVNPATAARRL